MKKDKLVILIGGLVGVLVITAIVFAGSTFSIRNKQTPVNELKNTQNSASQPEPQQDNEFPKQFEGFDLVQMVSGPEAIRQISQLHGSQISIKEGYIAMYQGNKGEFILWISDSNNEKEAVELLQIMDQKMPQSKAFSNHKIETLNKKEIHYVYGMNMDNYYYRIGTKVYWVGLPAQSPQELLTKVLETF